MLYIFISSFVGIIALLGWCFYLVRGKSKKELLLAIASDRSFFAEFEERLGPTSKSFLKNVWRFFVSLGVHQSIKNIFSRLSGYIHGRHFLEKNGCRGYWQKLNGTKKRKND